MWCYLIPILIFGAIAFISYQLGKERACKELKEDIKKYKLTKIKGD